MLHYSHIVETMDYLQQAKSEGKTIGFVPTMGALHEGHLELMRRAKRENDLLCVSIFVNPIQFNNLADLEKYPRNLSADIQLLHTVSCDVLFAPNAKEMYPEAITETFDFGALEKVMEGAFRPGHFNGVGVVVKKLFEITMPHKAYFGEKDYQQLAIIQKLVDMESMPLEVIPCPIVREADGLAMSSRNARLSEREREIAPRIFQILQQAQGLVSQYSPGQLKQWVINEIGKTKAFTLEYFEIAEDKGLQLINHWDTSIGSLGFIALNLGNVRLIDNIRFI